MMMMMMTSRSDDSRNDAPVNEEQRLMERAEELVLLAVDCPERFFDEYREVSERCRKIDWPDNPDKPKRNKRGSNMLKPQCKAVLMYMLRADYISVRAALLDLKCGSLSARISDLRKAGYTILKELETNHGTGRTFMKYRVTRELKNAWQDGVDVFAVENRR